MSNIFDPHIMEFIINDLQRCESADALLVIMKEATRLVGAANISYYSDSETTVQPTDQPSFFTYGRDWAERYLRMEYGAIDPVVVDKPCSAIPTDWTILRERRPSTDWLFREAASYGVGTQGITIPVRGTAVKGVFSITANCSEQEWQKMRWTYCAFGSVLAMHLHEMVLYLTEQQLGPSTLPLTKRQHECLSHYALGYSPKETAALIGISDTMVRRHLHASKTKLRCVTLPEALSKATRLQIV